MTTFQTSVEKIIERTARLTNLFWIMYEKGHVEVISTHSFVHHGA